MSVAQILNLKTGRISDSAIPEDLEVNKISFSGGDNDDQVRIGLTGDVDGDASIAIGKDSSTSAGSCVAIGLEATSTGTGGVSIGTEANSAEDSLALGAKAKATAENSIAIGHEATANYGSQLVIQTNSESAIAPDDSRKGVYTDAIGEVSPTNNDYLVRYNPDRQELFLKKDSNTVFDFGSYVEIIMGQLATEDPQNQGQLWNDDGTMKISAGS